MDGEPMSREVLRADRLCLRGGLAAFGFEREAKAWSLFGLRAVCIPTYPHIINRDDSRSLNKCVIVNFRIFTTEQCGWETNLI